MLRFIMVLCLLFITPFPAVASERENDTRPLTISEKNIFIPLVCQGPSERNKMIHCTKILGFPADSGQKVEDSELSLEAIAYGSFTRQNAEEAYVSYMSYSLEPHVNNFGGGILFERINDQWKLIKWYRGSQMKNCLTFSVENRQKMLCLNGYAGQGEIDSSVWVEQVPADGDATERDLILAAQDARKAGGPKSGPFAGSNYQCGLQRAQDEAILLRIHKLKRSRVPGFFAEASVTYATARDAGNACKKARFARVKETRGVVRFVLRNKTIEALTPAKFAKTDYN